MKEFFEAQSFFFNKMAARKGSILVVTRGFREWMGKFDQRVQTSINNPMYSMAILVNNTVLYI